MMIHMSVEPMDEEPSLPWTVRSLCCVYALQRIRRSEDGDALVLVQIEEIFVARDNEVGIGGHRARKDVIIVGISADRGWQRFRLDDLNHAFIVLH